ncbi:hypothetical protein ACQCRI_00030 [Ralstonia pseudosolanacearum]|uniref:hypothetical protein n=1 Tax=Ralstonia pseudosolanacearum TaxID=1310165 RepID=UPI003CEAC685
MRKHSLSNINPSPELNEVVDIPDSELIVLFIFNDFSVVPGAGCRVAGGGWRVAGNRMVWV